jgi:hypothetical protein
MLLIAFTGELIKGIDRKNYKLFGESGAIDSCLDEKSFPKGSGEYSVLKKKYLLYLQ